MLNLGFLARKTGIPFETLVNGMSVVTLRAVMEQFTEKVKKTNGNILW